ncbi:hypothetical protein [Prevotella lacticifex]|uniref:Uncharacterized protein n=1 Tax=Prevotella lacticifex TaxID=2854755 RepID=A0A9R1CY02_9BACT|nr:hypothetical protein [Prevotella lacticifex]GJG35262.1 hypothetical protein PRLR5003_04190 [Prevotella lacticifex]GJG39687.1 hypothetical protein PRLR5019_16580 [Prevotella lacticifex]GJG41631.1 hypothetical protein PRLR5025_04170 [Prevotella lacticifex]GJG46043.1 hypothetical protein PRLR5027_16380 [Prevotella lacticifex]GJG47982.1 hypothetical protein PRLR5052_03950 [Prevotella lacticifex]
MAQSGDNIKNLYDALKDEYDLGSEQDFRTSMSDKTNRQNLYIKKPPFETLYNLALALPFLA